MKKKTPVSVQRYDFSIPEELPFTGREAICKHVEEKLLAGASIFLCGIRQVGKSTIADKVIKSLESRKGCMCVKVSVVNVYDDRTPYVEQFATLIVIDKRISEACKKAGIDVVARKWTPLFVQEVVEQIHEKLGVRIVLFVDELVKYRAWAESEGTAFINMLESFVEKGNKIGVSLCLISQLSLNMICQKTPGNCAGLFSRLSNNQVFVPPFKKEELALFCKHSSIPSQSAIEELYKRTSGYADLIFPVIDACDKLSGERRDELVQRVLDDEELRLKLRTGIRRTYEAYQEFDLYRIEQVSELLRRDYRQMGLIDADNKFTFAEWIPPVTTTSTLVMEKSDKRNGRGREGTRNLPVQDNVESGQDKCITKRPNSGGHSKRSDGIAQRSNGDLLKIRIAERGRKIVFDKLDAPKDFRITNQAIWNIIDSLLDRDGAIPFTSRESAMFKRKYRELLERCIDVTKTRRKITSARLKAGLY